MSATDSEAPTFRVGMLCLACVPLFGVAYCLWSSLLMDPALANLEFSSGLLAGAVFFGVPALVPAAGVFLGILALRRNEPRAALTLLGLGFNIIFLLGSCFFFLLGIGLGGV